MRHVRFRVATIFVPSRHQEQHGLAQRARHVAGCGSIAKGDVECDAREGTPGRRQGPGES